MDDKTRKALIRLAYNRPELREEILPLVTEAKTASKPLPRALTGSLSVSAEIKITDLAAIDDRQFTVSGELRLASDAGGAETTKFAGTVEIDSSTIAFHTDAEMPALHRNALQTTFEERHEDVFKMAMELGPHV